MIYGLGGDDRIRIAHGLRVGTVIYGGAGNDRLFDNNRGASRVYGQSGNDLIVTVEGGADRAYGGFGTDSYWVDASDTVVGVSAGERAVGAVHRIRKFYQPYTNQRGARGYVPLAIAGQNLRDPALTGRADRYASFPAGRVFANGPQYNDIRQGGVGDCYFLGALASLAHRDPWVIRQMVTPLGDGTFAVRFYRNGEAQYLRVDGDLPVTQAGSLAYAKLTPNGELWAALAEKAYAYFRYGMNSYASISGGWMSTVYQEVTNRSTRTRYTSGMSAPALADYVRGNLSAGHAITMGSSSGCASPIVGSHAYMVKSIDSRNRVTVYNPWGYDGRGSDGNGSDGLIRL